MATFDFSYFEKLQGNALSLRHLYKVERISRALVVGLAINVLTFAVGCSGSKESTVSGRVTLDGSPVTMGSVAFEPQGGGMLALGNLDGDGNYELMTNQEVGIASGSYRVKVLARERSPDPPDGGLPPPGKLLVPEKFTNTATSDLVYEVATGSNQIDIALQSP